ncbi:MAG: HD domain-containing protein [Desulfobacterales bacterium]|jgi:HD-GYP domain-containing protein (c-di-GMP phosphodiesterase class II)|nr:HD domain-containing protein [Desulfobacterales bacterium]
MAGRLYIPVRSSQLQYYIRVPLFFETAPGVYQLYKSPGMGISDVRIRQAMHPRLYIQQNDRMAAAAEVQKGFNREIARSIETGDVTSVKASLCSLVAETLAEPRAGMLQSLPQTMEVLVSGYSKQPGLLRMFATISNKDYSTVIHSVNVMALTLGYCFHSGVSLRETRRLGLSALLHDVGKSEIPSDILQAPRKLTDKEFEIMKAHPSIGSRIIKEINRLGEDIALGALEHHEKLDGSGYPKGMLNISFSGQIIGIIDCYEALTNEDRPYRRAMDPLETLNIIKSDVEAGKFDRTLFEKFCYSLL